MKHNARNNQSQEVYLILKIRNREVQSTYISKNLIYTQNNLFLSYFSERHYNSD